MKIEQKVIGVEVAHSNSELDKQAEDGWIALSITMDDDKILILFQRVVTHSHSKEITDY